MQKLEPTQWAKDAWTGHQAIREYCSLPASAIAALKARTPHFGFGLYGEIVYLRTYSRLMSDGRQEGWADTVIRVIEGMLSVRKDWYFKHGLPWDETKWSCLGSEMAQAAYDFHWLPPGRGLWAMGTDYVRQRGSGALFNCAATELTRLSQDIAWIADASMCGIGIGFSALQQPVLNLTRPSGAPLLYQVPDTKEGWVESIKVLLQSYEVGSSPIEFDYDLIRRPGTAIRGFGGTSGGYKPLATLHNTIRERLETFLRGQITSMRLRVDLANLVGNCTAAGNVRRNAQIALGDPNDEEFWALKDYEQNPERAKWGGASNNSLLMQKTEDFGVLPKVAGYMRLNGEPGILNVKNVQKFARFGRVKSDTAWLVNPCSEIPLESRELCNLSEVFPSNCPDEDSFYRACEFATIYSSTVTLLPTHWKETNSIIARNRRIGVSISGVTSWLATNSTCAVTKQLRRAYDRVERVNANLAKEAGIPVSVRLTTVKPSGTISPLAGVSAGVHFPTGRFLHRRVRVGQETPMFKVLIQTSIPHQPDVVSPNTEVFSFALDYGLGVRSVAEVSIWEQLTLGAMMQREWSDNSVSQTLSFDPDKEGSELEHALSSFAPVLKSISALPRRLEVYKQMPEELLDKASYDALAAKMPVGLNLTKMLEKAGGSDGVDQKYCDGDNCSVKTTD